MSYCIDELLLPIIHGCEEKAIVRLVCSDIDGKYQLHVVFPGMESDLLQNSSVDEIGSKI